MATTFQSTFQSIRSKSLRCVFHNRYRALGRTLALTAALAGTGTVHAAEIQVAMEDPQWTFLLKGSHTQAASAELTRDESEFFRSIQPLLSKGDYNGALAQFNQRNSAEDSAALYELKGQVLLNLKRYKEAATALNKALELQPGLAVSHRALGMLYLMQQDFKNAHKHLVQTLELGGGDAQTYGQLAYVNLQLHKPHSAVAGYQQALYLDAGNSQWYQGLLYALIESNDLTQAGSLVDEMLADKPNDSKLWLQRSQIAMRTGDELKALASMETALQLGNKRADNIAIAAQLHMQLGNPGRAADLLSSDISRFARSGNMDSVWQMATWMASRDEWTALAKVLKAANAYSKLLSAQQRAGFAVLDGQLAIAHKNFKTAEGHLRRAIDMDPANGEALLTMARVQRERNNLQSANMYYLRAEAMPDFKVRALQGRAQVEIDRKDYPQALTILRALYKAEPNRQQVFENIQALERIVRNQV